MTLTPLLTSGAWIVVHAFAALTALMVGTAVLMRKKGDFMHKVMGRIWVGLMALTAISSFWIAEIRMWGPYSWIHLLSIWTLFSLVAGVWAIRRGKVRTHKGAMTGLYGGGLILAGGLTLLPGRIMHRVLFTDGGASAVWLGLGLLLGLAVVAIWRRRFSVQARG